jgi:hypothetical protein
MGYSIELYFEAAFEQHIRAIWERLAQARIPSFYQRMGGRPHLTLAVCEQVDEPLLCETLTTFADSLSSCSVNFPAVALIPGSLSMVYLVPVVSAAVRHMHQALYDLLHQHGSPPYPRYAPDCWLPHCPISKELSYADAIATLDICGAHHPTMATRIEELGLLRIRPSRPIQAWKLGV